MPVRKGHTNNPNGRPSDPNITLLRTKQRQILVDRLDKVAEELDKLSGKDFLEYFLRIQNYLLPALPAEQPVINDENGGILSIFKYIEERMKGDLKKVG